MTFRQFPYLLTDMFVPISLCMNCVTLLTPSVLGLCVLPQMVGGLHFLLSFAYRIISWLPYIGISVTVFIQRRDSNFVCFIGSSFVVFTIAYYLIRQPIVLVHKQIS